jgi:uncharacterized protein YaiL (DUF2058 family)
MADSLREQLLSLGIAKPKPKPERKPVSPTGGAGRPPVKAGKRQRPKAGTAPRSQEEIDLAKAYAIRSQKEKQERLQAEREAQAQARERRERKARLGALLQGKTLNDPGAEVQRHFEHKGRIRHLYVTAEQLRRLNLGELGIVQLAGRYLLVERAVLEQAVAISEEALVLLVDPDAPAEDDVPADLVW